MHPNKHETCRIKNLSGQAEPDSGRSDTIMTMMRTTLRRSPLALSLMLGLAALGGCATSPWEESYSGVTLTVAKPDAAQVVVRDVPWDRYESAQATLETMRTKSDVHKDEWSAEKKTEYKSTLLKGLQVSEDPAGVDVLGSSMFKSTEPVRPDSGELAAFASKIGANRVVWASRGLGKRNIVVREPVWSYTNGSDFYREQPDGRHRSSTYTESVTTWVPVVVDVDETAWVAYFLRIPTEATASTR